jgi:hypothetical protein
LYYDHICFKGENCCYVLLIQRWGEQPAIMAVGVIDGTSEAIFNTLMSLDPSRSE